MNRRRYLPAFGIDVDARMAKSARQHGLEVQVVTFEEGDPGGPRLDAVAAGQTWHWVDPAAVAAKAAQALRADSPFSGNARGCVLGAAATIGAVAMRGPGTPSPPRSGRSVSHICDAAAAAAGAAPVLRSRARTRRDGPATAIAGRMAP